MPHIQGGISRLFHGPQGQTADQRFFRLSFQGKKQLLNLFWMKMFSPCLHIEAEIANEGVQPGNLVRVRLLMGPVYKRQLLPEIIFRHGLIGQKHEIFNNIRSHISLIRMNVRRISVLIENDLGFRKIKINGAALSSFLFQDGGRLFHKKTQFPDILPLAFRMRLSFQDRLYSRITHPFIHSYDGLHNLMSDDISPGIHLHNAA